VEGRLALGLALWVCVLPLVVLLTALLLGASLSLPLLAAAALIVLGGCVLAAWRADAGLEPQGPEQP
jgi:hypothetical protein